MTRWSPGRSPALSLSHSDAARVVVLFCFTLPSGRQTVPGSDGGLGALEARHNPGTTGKNLSTLEKHTIPSFYACYLLRSKAGGKFGRRTYVGST